MIQLFKSLVTRFTQQHKIVGDTSMKTLDMNTLSQVGGGGPVGSWK